MPSKESRRGSLRDAQPHRAAAAASSSPALQTSSRMHASHVAAGGFLLALLALRLEALPAPQNLPRGPSGRTAALGRELAELLAAGPARGGGSKQGSAGQQRGKGSSAPASSRLLRDLRTDAKQARPGWARGGSPEHHAGGGGGGGGGGSRRSKGASKKGQPQGCFGLKLDRIGALSGLGC